MLFISPFSRNNITQEKATNASYIVTVFTWSLMIIASCSVNNSYAGVSKQVAAYQQKLQAIHQATFIVEDAPGNTDQYNAVNVAGNKPLVPASTLKVVTAYLAIKRWGLEHRFNTDFYLKDDVLWIKGYGDPFVTSEEILLMSQALKKLNIGDIKQIRVDNSYFPELRLNGRGKSDNPYDAGNAAVVVNFNTIALKKVQGKILSGEAQTPLTPMAKSLGEQVKGGFVKGKKRISLPKGRDQSALYFAQVFSQLHFARDLKASVARLPKDAKLVYRHTSSKNMQELIVAMLKYSNNFIANQLFLLMPENTETMASIDVKTAQRSYMQKLQREFNFNEANFVDGAGLSRLNKISGQQMMAVLSAFRPWMNLLPQNVTGIRAKTGTLSDNHSLAGYVLGKKGKWRAFVLLINQKMPYNYRYQVAKALLKNS